MDTEIITPTTHPDHHTVGHNFKGPWGVLYYCDSYDPSYGYWMTPLPKQNLENPERKNVSERAIDRTYHRVRK